MWHLEQVRLQKDTFSGVDVVCCLQYYLAIEMCGMASTFLLKNIGFA